MGEKFSLISFFLFVAHPRAFTGVFRRQVQKSDRINSDRQSGSDQHGLTHINSNRLVSSRS